MTPSRTGYAVCTLIRSGSTWLAELLDSTGVLGHPAEYFSTRFRQRLDTPDYPSDPADQVDYVLRHGTTPNGVYGFKIYPLQLEGLLQRVRWTERFPALKFVHWRRRDVLGQALSRTRAVQTQRWRASFSGVREPAYDGEAILESITWLAAQEARWELFFARNGLEPLRLVYEDALRAPAETVSAVARLVGLDPAPPADVTRVGVTVQRDEITAAWRERFLDEYADLDVFGRL
ncbi:MAG: hypothetical protein INR70_17795 [Parafilimonas terrae]|nr:hypothetical protein [Parafilimonas terrae]